MNIRIELPAWLQKWLRPETLLAGIGLIALLLLAVLWLSWRWRIAEDRMEMMQARADQGFLVAPSSSRSVHLDPSQGERSATVGGGTVPERIDLAIAARSSRYDRFRVSILRDDGTLVLHADRLVRDSNNDLRLSFNTSMLAPGDYLVRVDGIERNGAFTRIGAAMLHAGSR